MSTTIQFQNSFQSLPEFLFENVAPTPLKNPKLVDVTTLRDTLRLASMSDQELRSWLNGETFLEGEQRIATRYAGHQFGVWAGQLGDGRAISLGETLTIEGRLEIQTKGSGLTPFSRMGDGKAVIRSSVREYLCSEAMKGLKIPTTRVLALLTGEDEVYRETVERSALVARVMPSNLRFGHFELCFHFEKERELKALIDYTQKTFFPQLTLEDMLLEIVSRTASLLARWQLVGFCHGVMNTDNMSILGLTIDYGPFGFLEDTQLNFICNHSDHQGRYAFGRQPSVALWNLERLLVCFINYVPRDKLQEIINQFAPMFQHQFLAGARAKLGFLTEDSGDLALMESLLQVMHQGSFDYTYTLRLLGQYQKGHSSSWQEFWDYYGQRPEMLAWLQRYDERLSRESLSESERHALIKSVSPKFVLKNYIAQRVIEDVEQGRNHSLKQWLQILSRPFEEHPGFEEFARPTPPEHKNYEVSCSS